MLHIPPTKKVKYSSPNHSKKRPTQKSLPFGKWRFREKGHDNGTKAEKDKAERATGLGRRTKEEI